MTRLGTGGWALAGAGAAAAAHVLAWPYTVVMVAAAAGYRLLAERARRKTLVALVTQAPGGTIAIMDGGPGGPAMWLRVGDGPKPVTAEAWRGR
jgi:hypothetical protein